MREKRGHARKIHPGIKMRTADHLKKSLTNGSCEVIICTGGTDENHT
jgi:hypothetical protein